MKLQNTENSTQELTKEEIEKQIEELTKEKIEKQKKSR